jgi:DNA-directed RNA polymerase subunit RPC12/RpoP
MEKIRACPICPNCGYKKFVRVKVDEILLKCVNCGKEIVL